MVSFTFDTYCIVEKIMVCFIDKFRDLIWWSRFFMYRLAGLNLLVTFQTAKSKSMPNRAGTKVEIYPSNLR